MCRRFGLTSLSLIQKITCQIDIDINVLNGDRNVGGFIGWGHHSTFIDCVNRGDIQSNGRSSGGIVCQGSGLTFKSCSNSGNITSTLYSRRNYRN